jgi:hypothetical protein
VARVLTPCPSGIAWATSVGLLAYYLGPAAEHIFKLTGLPASPSRRYSSLDTSYGAATATSSNPPAPYSARPVTTRLNPRPQMTGVRPPLTARDLFSSPESAEATERLAGCTAACKDYAESVFAALHESPREDR